MSSLSDRQRALVRTLPAQQRIARIAGIVLSLLGVVYMIWSVSRFDIGADPAREIGFDAFVTAPIAMLFDARRRGVESIHATTPLEAHLLHRQIRGMNFSGALLLLGFRMTLALFPLLLGLSTLTVYIERARLLRIIAALDASTGEPVSAQH